MKRIISMLLAAAIVCTTVALSAIQINAETLSAKLTDTSDFSLSSVELTRNYMRIGTNLGNYFEGYEMREEYTRPDGITDWVEYKTKLSGYPMITEDYIKFLKDSGIQAVRIPITWFPMLTKDGTGDMVAKEVWYDSTQREDLWYNGVIHKDWLAEIKKVVDWVIENDMYCIINIHHDGANNKNLPIQFDSAHMEQTKKYFRNIWGQVGEYFKDYGSKLIFEGFNEVTDYNSSTEHNDSHNTATLQALNEFISIIRSQGGNNAQRFLLCPGYNGSVFLGTNNSDIITESNTTYNLSKTTESVINKLRSYDSADDKLILSSHTYPDTSGASWRLGQANTLMNKLGIGCIFGEIGVTPWINQSADQNPKTNNASFAKDVRKYSDQYKVSCFWWDGPGRTHGLTNRYYCHPNDVSGFGNYVGKTISCPTFTDISQMTDSAHPYWAKFYTKDSTLPGAGKYAIVCSQDKITELEVANAANGYYYMHFENYDGLVTLYLSDDGVNYTRDFTGVAYKFGEVAYKNYRIYGSTENTVKLSGNYEIDGFADTEETLVKTKYDAYTCYTTNSGGTHSAFRQDDSTGSPGTISAYTNISNENYIEYTLPNVAAGKYMVSLRSRDFTGRAVMSISVNGEVINSAFDSNNTTFGVYDHDNIGSFTQNNTGIATVRFTATSTGNLYLQYIYLTPIEEPTTAAPTTTSAPTTEPTTISAAKYGDLNQDNTINLLDLIALRKHLAKWSVSIDETAADCNADGKVNLLDLILLRKYLAKWNVTFG